MSDGVVRSVSRSHEHRFSKEPVLSIVLRAGFGVEGDAHAGATVQHRSRVAADPTQPNLRQVHLLPSEFLADVREQGYAVGAGDLGENVLTDGLDLLALPRDTLLRLGPDAVVRITGLRNPCSQIDHFRPGLLRLAVGREADGTIVRRAGVMGVVTAGGAVSPGHEIHIELPAPPHHRLERV
ncbi:MOSC domain-containing protein [Nocardioides sp.]|uniref:MOSC domain-containing protein n=1 Tax=Nocardioides sp. TaxID=35761 RepID=UPI002735A154|nr:MOSC domain-containing protein [Nocardioides sp.]MDP3892048.1 MOSC domain-containing protein [Nocardioides sp.]